MGPWAGARLKFIAICIIVHICSGSLPEPSKVRLVNNGYEGLVVGIHEDIEENEELIRNIKSLFTRASNELFVATRRRAYFRSITILVPKSWTRKTYNQATWQTYLKASIRVGNVKDINTPFVTHYTKCGESGEFMYLPKIMFFEKEYKKLKESALPAKEIVHEWAHLRWGLYDEYAMTDSDGKKNSFYMSSRGAIEPVKCSNALKLRKRCYPRNVDQTLQDHNSKCWSLLDRQSEESSKRASYLFDTTVTHVQSFCDNNETDIDTLHNAEAPTRQNQLCNYRSAWEVMRAHVDFAGAANPQLDQDSASVTIPQFTVVQKSPGKIVVVMDISGSMQTDSQHIRLSDAVKKYILATVPDNSSVGLVRFDGTAEILTPILQLLDSENSRQTLAARVQPLHRGMTSIGAGMRAGCNLLKAHGLTTGSSMLVVTDGQENTPPFMRHVLPEIMEAGIVVDSLLFTAQADKNLINSSSMTGGRSFFFSGKSDTEDLADILTAMTADQQDSAELSPIKLSSKGIRAGAGETSCERVIVDEELGKESLFSFTWVTSSNFEINITSPSTQTNYTVIPGLDQRSYVQIIPGISETGKWNVCIKNLMPNEVRVALQAQSKARNAAAQAPVVVSFSFSRTTNVNFSESAEPLVLYATVTKGYAPLINATVIAAIEDGTGKNIELELRDNGAGADSIKDDGTYSRYLPVLNSTGMYSTKVRVEGNEGTAVVSGLFGSMSNSIDDFEGSNDTLPTITKTPVPQFERITSGELIQVVAVKQLGVGAAVDSTPPSRIQDLKLVETSLSRQTITVQFTSAGDDFDEGTAARYHIRSAPNFQQLRGNFDNCARFNDTDVVNGTLTSPMPSGGTEIFTLRAPIGQPMTMAVVAEDEAGNVGQPSNFITAQIAEETPEEPATIPTTEEMSPSVKRPDGLFEVYLGSISAAIFFVTASVIAIVIAAVMRRKRRSGKASFASSCEEGEVNVGCSASAGTDLADFASGAEAHCTNTAERIASTKADE